MVGGRAHVLMPSNTGDKRCGARAGGLRPVVRIPPQTEFIRKNARQTAGVRVC